MEGFRTLREELRRVKKPRKCSNGHELKRGDLVSIYVGIVDGDFTHWEECWRCKYNEDEANHALGDPWVAA